MECRKWYFVWIANSCSLNYKNGTKNRKPVGWRGYAPQVDIISGFMRVGVSLMLPHNGHNNKLTNINQKPLHRRESRKPNGKGKLGPDKQTLSFLLFVVFLCSYNRYAYKSKGVFLYLLPYLHLGRKSCCISVFMQFFCSFFF